MLSACERIAKLYERICCIFLSLTFVYFEVQVFEVFFLFKSFCGEEWIPFSLLTFY